MFENIIGQPIIETIKNDLVANTLPPSLLFSGSPAGAKGSSALELARVLSCQAADAIDERKTALWDCKCSSCESHRRLAHPDMLCMGPRSFQAEINAGKTLFLREPDNALRKIFLQRAVQKLLMRFSPVLWEGESKSTKFNKTLEDLEDDMDEFSQWKKSDAKKQEKLLNSIADNARKLELDCSSDAIPVSHIRNASYWLRLTPGGRRKVVIIENADKMNDSARNSLLKILEEPPEKASIILTSAKPDSLLPTILSRLRNYAFTKRSAETEVDVVNRVFRDGASLKAGGGGTQENIIARYLDQYLPVPSEALSPAAAYFLASIAVSAIRVMRKENMSGNVGDEEQGGQEILIAIGTHASSSAKSGGFGAPATDIKTLVAAVRAAAGKFEVRSMYGVFLEKICSALSQSLSECEQGGGAIAYRNALKEAIEESRLAVEIYNQSIELALERLAQRLIDCFAKAGV